VSSGKIVRFIVSFAASHAQQYMYEKAAARKFQGPIFCKNAVYLIHILWFVFGNRLIATRQKVLSPH